MAATTPHGSGGHHHITPPKTYVAVFAALTVLMLLTVWVAGVPIGNVGPIPGVWINNIIALAIATIKALLVIFFFMGVLYSSKLTKLWACAGFLVFAIMFFILADNFTRKNEPAPSWINNGEGSALPRENDPLSEQLPPENSVNLRPRQ